MYPSKISMRTFALAMSSLCSTAAFADVPAGSPYLTDSQHSYVEDATSKDIGQVNMITCLMSAMRPDALVNQGTYAALVDQTKCDPESHGGGSGSDNSSQVAYYMNATINSTRASNNDPMRAKIWIDDTDGDGQQRVIFVNLSASEAPTAANPYGAFRVDFCGVGQGSQCMMQGFLETSNGGLSYFQNENEDSDRNRITAMRMTTAGVTSGSGKLDSTETEGNQSVQQTFAFAYNEDYFLRGDQCFSRDSSDPETGLSVWRYGLYDAVTGQRVTRNSGFPIEYVNAGQTYNGYIGYGGLSFQGNVGDAVASGATVNKIDYSSNTPTRTPYTLVKSGGKLTKYTKHTRTLHELDQIEFTTFVGDVTGFFSGATPNTQYDMHWDDAAGDFKVTGKMVCSDNGCQSQDLSDGPKSVDASYWHVQGGIQGWSQSLGGELFINLSTVSGAVQSDQITVVYREQSLVYPADMPATLYCVRDCPTAASMSDYFGPSSSAQSPFTAESYNNWQPSNTVSTYSTDTQNVMLLDDASQPVVFTNRDALQQRPQYGNGVRTGRLFTNLAAAACTPGSGSAPYCDYKVNDLDVYYVWETGANNWNQFAALKDSNDAFVTFDAPLQFSYTVPVGAAYGEYSGKSIVLQYGSFGELWGIPGHCVSHLTNQPASCDQQDARYVSAFALPEGATVSSGDSQYLVKWLEREVRFARKSKSVCDNANLVVPSNVTLPTAADLKNPAEPASDIYLGAKPEVTGLPRVVHGEVKY